MISRRDFLKILGVGGAVLLAPIPLLNTPIPKKYPTITIAGHDYPIYDFTIEAEVDITEDYTFGSIEYPEGLRHTGVDMRLGEEAINIMTDLFDNRDRFEFVITQPDKFKVGGEGLLSSVTIGIPTESIPYLEAEIVCTRNIEMVK